MLIVAMLKRKRKCLVLQSLNTGTSYETSAEKVRYARLPFLGNILYKPARLLEYNRPACYTTKSLGYVLFNTKDTILKRMRSGVYRLECQEWRVWIILSKYIINIYVMYVNQLNLLLIFLISMFRLQLLSMCIPRFF